MQCNAVITLFFPLQQGDAQVRLPGVGDGQCKRSRKHGLTFSLFLGLLPAYSRFWENFSLHLSSTDPTFQATLPFPWEEAAAGSPY